MHAYLSGIGGGSAGPISDPVRDLPIGCFAAVCRARVADLLGAVQARFPNAVIGIQEMSRATLLGSVRARTLALAILPGAPEPGFASYHLWDDAVVAALSSANPLALQPEVTVDALRRLPMQSGTDAGGSAYQDFAMRRLFDGGTMPSVRRGAIQPRPGDRLPNDYCLLLAASDRAPVHPGIAVRAIDDPRARHRVHALWLPDAAIDWLPVMRRFAAHR